MSRFHWTLGYAPRGSALLLDREPLYSRWKSKQSRVLNCKQILRWSQVNKQSTTNTRVDMFYLRMLLWHFKCPWVLGRRPHRLVFSSQRPELKYTNSVFIFHEKIALSNILSWYIMVHKIHGSVGVMFFRSWFSLVYFVLFFFLWRHAVLSFGYVPIGKTREKLLAQYTYWWLKKCLIDEYRIYDNKLQISHFFHPFAENMCLLVSTRQSCKKPF